MAMNARVRVRTEAPGVDHAEADERSRQAPTSVTQPPENLRYARLLDGGTRLGLLVLVLSFAAYLSGLMQAHVPVDRLPELWGHPVRQYLELTQAPTGWGWVALIARGDVAALAGIVVLSGCSLLALGGLVPIYWRRGDRIYAFLCGLEIIVIVLAASGWLSGGH